MANDTTILTATRAQVRRAVDDRLARSIVAGKTRKASGELAATATFDARTRRLIVELASGVGLRIPVAGIEGLAGAPAAIIRNVRVEGGGYGLHWPALDLDLAVPDLVAGSFGSSTWMTALARQGGKVTSKAKQRASRENGRKGGRPRKRAVPGARTSMR